MVIIISYSFCFRYCCLSCKQCFEGDEVHYRYRISFVASDRTQVANVTVFGSCLDVFFGASATDFTRFESVLSHTCIST